jgi:hypothetical protein
LATTIPFSFETAAAGKEFSIVAVDAAGRKVSSSSENILYYLQIKSHRRYQQRKASKKYISTFKLMLWQVTNKIWRKVKAFTKRAGLGGVENPLL